MTAFTKYEMPCITCDKLFAYLRDRIPNDLRDSEGELVLEGFDLGGRHIGPHEHIAKLRMGSDEASVAAINNFSTMVNLLSDLGIEHADLFLSGLLLNWDRHEDFARAQAISRKPGELSSQSSGPVETFH